MFYVTSDHYSGRYHDYLNFVGEYISIRHKAQAKAVRIKGTDLQVLRVFMEKSESLVKNLKQYIEDNIRPSYVPAVIPGTDKRKTILRFFKGARFSQFASQQATTINAKEMSLLKTILSLKINELIALGLTKREADFLMKTVEDVLKNVRYRKIAYKTNFVPFRELSGNPGTKR
jgi:hypothetical protein